MKRTLPPSCFTAAALLLAPALLAETSRSSSASGASNEIFSITERELDRQVTVADLLGNWVVDQNNEPIGSLRDVDLTEVFSGSTASAVPAGRVSLLIESRSDAELMSVDSGDVAYDQTRERLALTIAVPAGAGTAQAASAARGDDELAPPDVAVNDPANTLEPVAVAAVPGSDIVVATVGAEVLEIEEALASNAATSEVADQISVMSSNEAILLTGALASQEQREKVLQVVREASDREVRDLMQVAAE